MALVAVPNVSEGRDRKLITVLANRVRENGGDVLDVHSDAVHNRSVLTIHAPANLFPTALAALAREAAATIDLRTQEGVHPRLGALDVCPIVPQDDSISHAVEVARAVGGEIARSARLPVYMYGAAATREDTRELPSLRRGGLSALIQRAASGLPPDLGPPDIDERSGVVCVGARNVLVAFNVWLRADRSEAEEIARSLRAADGGLPGVRALGLAIGDGRSQVSMNLIDPETTGIDAAFAAVAERARAIGVEVVATEIVGLPPKRFLPDPTNEAARLLIEPGRSLEAVLPN